jgi:hypothetical protein
MGEAVVLVVLVTLAAVRLCERSDLVGGSYGSAEGLWPSTLELSIPQFAPPGTVTEAETGLAAVGGGVGRTAP